MRECEEYVRPETSSLEDVVGAFVHNMELAGVCKARHDALVKRLMELK